VCALRLSQGQKTFKKGEPKRAVRSFVDKSGQVGQGGRWKKQRGIGVAQPMSRREQYPPPSTNWLKGLEQDHQGQETDAGEEVNLRLGHEKGPQRHILLPRNPLLGKGQAKGDSEREEVGKEKDNLNLG